MSEKVRTKPELPETEYQGLVAAIAKAIGGYREGRVRRERRKALLNATVPGNAVDTGGR